jgi:hypothetical protein
MPLNTDIQMVQQKVTTIKSRYYRGYHTESVISNDSAHEFYTALSKKMVDVERLITHA